MCQTHVHTRSPSVQKLVAQQNTVFNTNITMCAQLCPFILIHYYRSSPHHSQHVCTLQYVCYTCCTESYSVLTQADRIMSLLVTGYPPPLSSPLPLFIPLKLCLSICLPLSFTLPPSLRNTASCDFTLIMFMVNQIQCFIHLFTESTEKKVFIVRLTKMTAHRFT